MSHSNLVINGVYDYLTNNKPTSIDVEFKNDFFKDNHLLTQAETDDLAPSKVVNGIMILSLDEELPQEQNLEVGSGKEKPLNTIYYDYKISRITKDFGCVRHKNIKFKLIIKTEKDRLDNNMNEIIDHYYKAVYETHGGKIPITLESGDTRYIYLRKEPTTRKTKNKKDDISEYEFIFECFYAI